MTQLEERVTVVESEMTKLETVDRRLDQLMSKIKSLTEQVARVEVWHQDYEQTEKTLLVSWQHALQLIECCCCDQEDQNNQGCTPLRIDTNSMSIL